MSQPITRNFRQDAAKILQRTGVIRNLFAARQAEFLAFDPALDAAFLAQWSAALQQGLGSGSDETEADRLAGYTQAVDAAMAEARATVATLRYYAERAFAGRERTVLSFGFGPLTKYRKDPARVALLLEVMHRRATTEQAALLAAGMTASQINDLLGASIAVGRAEADQEEFKLLRLQLTEKRMEKLVEAWNYARRVGAAAEVIYRTDDVARAQFLISPAGRRSKKG